MRTAYWREDDELVFLISHNVNGAIFARSGSVCGEGIKPSVVRAAVASLKGQIQNDMERVAGLTLQK